MQILAFGDSITNGSHVPIGWADQMRSWLYDRFHENDPDGYPRMYNLGIPGETTQGLIARFDVETKARVRGKYGTALFIFSFGTNDVATVGTSSENVVPVEQYITNLWGVLEKVRTLKGHIVLLASPPVIEGKLNPNDKKRFNTDIRKYNSSLVELAAEFRADVVDLFTAFEGEQDLISLFNDDGIHPNQAGHAIIFNLVREYVGNLLENNM